MSYWMKCSFLTVILTILMVTTAAQADASVDKSGTYQDTGVMLLVTPDIGAHPSIILAQYHRGYGHRGYRGRGYGHRGYRGHGYGHRGYRGDYYDRPYRHHRRYRHWGPPPPPFGPPPRW